MKSNINEINEKLNDKQREFIHNLSNYINTPLIFYGSILRNDYIPEKSDIDIAIFTDNENSIIYTLCDFLNMSKSDFKKIVYKINSNVVYGYKSVYNNPKLNIELSIYNNKDKTIIANTHHTCEHLPYHIEWMLIIIKCLYYRLGFISIITYKKCKNFLMDSIKDTQFMLLDIS